MITSQRGKHINSECNINEQNIIQDILRLSWRDRSRCHSHFTTSRLTVSHFCTFAQIISLTPFPEAILQNETEAGLIFKSLWIKVAIDDLGVWKLHLDFRLIDICFFSLDI